jgi:hypothetical protein
MPRDVNPQEERNRNQNNPRTGEEIPGDTDAPDIVGRTGEEMPEVAHDHRQDDEIRGDQSRPTDKS